MRVLLLSEFFLSGQTTHVLDLARQLKRLGHDVFLVFAKVHSARFRSYYGPMLRELEIPYLDTPRPRELGRMVEQEQPHVIHVHSSTLFRLARALASEADIPFVVTIHGLGPRWQHHRRTLLAASRIVAVGPKSAQGLEQIVSSSPILIPNGVDTNLFTPAQKPPTLNLVYLGRTDPTKTGPLRRLAAVVQDLPEVEFSIYGSWDPPVDHVRFQGWLEEPGKVLASTHIMAGCGRSAREAMACGSAVLLLNTAYDGLVTPQLVAEADFDFSGNRGRFSLCRLQEDLQDLCADRERLSTLQRFGREYAKQHLDSATMAKNTLQVYQESIEAKANTRTTVPPRWRHRRLGS